MYSYEGVDISISTLTGGDGGAVVLRVCCILLLVAPSHSVNALVTPTSAQADQSNQLLRHIDLRSRLVTTLAGNSTGEVGIINYGYADGVATAASFWYPAAVCIDGTASFALVVR